MQNYLTIHWFYLKMCQWSSQYFVFDFSVAHSNRWKNQNSGIILITYSSSCFSCKTNCCYLLLEIGDKVFIFQSIEKENFAAAWDTKPRVIRTLEEFIVDIIEVIRFNINSRITEVTLDCLITISYIIFTNFAWWKLNSRANNIYRYHSKLFVCCSL